MMCAPSRYSTPSSGERAVTDEDALCGPGADLEDDASLEIARPVQSRSGLRAPSPCRRSSTPRSTVCLRSA